MNSVNITHRINSLTPSELVRKHILDPNHVVTEEEFSRLRIGAEAESDTDISRHSREWENDLRPKAHTA